MRHIALTAAVLLAAPSLSRAQAGVDDPAIRQLLAAVTTPPMREMWLNAIRSGSVPRLPDFVRFDEPEARRTLATSRGRGEQSQQHPFPAAVIADVRVYSARPLGEYHGAFRVMEGAPGRIVGRVDGHPEALVIEYRVPTNPALLDVRAGSELELFFQERFVPPSRDVVLHLAARAQTGNTLLFFMSEGSARPYQRTFDTPPFTVRQEPEGSAGMRVVIRQGDQGLRLTVDERGRIRQGGEVVEVIVLTNLFPRTPEPLPREDNPYGVSLVAYTVRQP